MKTNYIKTKVFTLFLITFFLLFSFPVFGQRVIDNVGVLSEIELSLLNEKAASLAASFNFDTLILLENNVGSLSMEDYSFRFLDNKYGVGVKADAVLFLITADPLEFHLTTSGRGNRIFNQVEEYKLFSRFVGLESMFEIYQSYFNSCEEFLELDAAGHYQFFIRFRIPLIIFAWIVSFGIGFVIVSIWKGQMNTAIGATHAAAYIVPNSLKFTAKTDKFLYSTTTKTRKAKSTTSSGGGLRGSSGSRRSRR